MPGLAEAVALATAVTAFAPTTAPWQIQLQGRIDTSIRAPIVEVDGFDTPAPTVARLKRSGRRVLCYLSAGSWEAYRPDRDAFPPEVLGRRYAGYPDERWLDIRRLDLLAPILERRIAMCARKGFDGVDPDNVDGFQNPTGFPLSPDDQLRFNRWLAAAAHRRDMAIALKNDADQVRQLVDDFDLAVVEECFEQRSCRQYQPFVRAGKAVLAIEYRTRPERFCPEARRRRFSAILKRRDLRSFRRTCPVET